MGSTSVALVGVCMIGMIGFFFWVSSVWKHHCYTCGCTSD